MTRKVLAAVLIVLLFFSCSDGNGIPVKEKPVRDILEITVAFWDMDTSFREEKDEYIRFLEDRFSIDMKAVNLNWSDYSRKILFWAASGELPDVFAGNFVLSDEYFKWIEEGIIRSLPDDLSPYPAVEAVTEQDSVSALRIDGNLYLFPRINAPDASYNSAERGIISRKDWRLELGMEVPETFDEYRELAKAFKERDPDANGLDDTIGMTFSNKNFISTVFLSTVPEAASKTWRYEEGRWIPGYASGDMIKGILELNELWKEGLLDPQTLSLTGNQGNYNFCTGKTGMLFSHTKPRKIYNLSTLWSQYNDTPMYDVIEFLPIWKNSEGGRYAFHEGKNFWSSSFFSSMVDDRKMARIMEFYDYLLSEEGQISLKYGIPGVDFILSEKGLERMDSSNMEEKYPSIRTLIDLPSWGGDISNWIKDEYSLSIYPEHIMDMCISLYEANKSLLSPVNMGIQYMYTPTKSHFEKGDSIFDNVLTAVIADDPAEEWKHQMDLLRREGLEIAIDEVNRKAAELELSPP